MNVLVLSPYPDRLAPALQAAGDFVSASDQPLRGHIEARFIICYGYRHMIREPYLTQFGDRIINLHIALLPWGKGADPNFWSWVHDTPKGVTIHRVDAGMDTGPILAQEEVSFAGLKDETLKTSYARLQCAVEMLFARKWPEIRRGAIEAKPQPAGGSYHRLVEKTEIFRTLPLGYDTPVRELAKLGKKAA